MFRYTKNAEYPISNFPICYFRRIDSYNVISDKVGISDFNGKHDVAARYLYDTNFLQRTVLSFRQII